MLFEFIQLINISFFVAIPMAMFIVQLVMLIYGIRKIKNIDSKRWLFISCFVPIIGSMLYFCIGRNKILRRKKKV